MKGRSALKTGVRDRLSSNTAGERIDPVMFPGHGKVHADVDT